MTWCSFCSTARSIETAYSSARDPTLPWGYWLREVDTPTRALIDENGQRWNSVRRAFWTGRLSMPAAPQQPGPTFLQPSGNDREMTEQMELMIAVLHVLARSITSQRAELANDVLNCSSVVSVHYMAWLAGHDLIRTGGSGFCLTDEGHAALLMLKATRPEELIDVEPGGAAMRLAGGPAMAHIANPAVDVGGARFVFESADIAKRPMITLLDRESTRGRMPTQKTIWSCAFNTPLERDRLFAWMCARSDRWQTWGVVAANAADGLTQHLLATYIASIDWTQPTGGELLLGIAHQS